MTKKQLKRLKRAKIKWELDKIWEILQSHQTRITDLEHLIIDKGD